MESSNKFVFDVVVAVVVVKDDGYIHSNTAVAAVDDWDTTSIFINLLDELFFSLFQKIQISRIASIYWTALTACLEG
jgi:hypothetical protein